jgi:hypothetical protein
MSSLYSRLVQPFVLVVLAILWSIPRPLTLSAEILSASDQRLPEGKRRKAHSAAQARRIQCGRRDADEC